MVDDALDQRARMGILRPDDEADRALRHSGEEILLVKNFGDMLRQAKPGEAGHGEKGPIELALTHLAQACIDIAPDQRDLKIGRSRRACAPRRREAVPSRAPCGRSISRLTVRPIKASRTSARGR